MFRNGTYGFSLVAVFLFSSAALAADSNFDSISHGAPQPLVSACAQAQQAGIAADQDSKTAIQNVYSSLNDLLENIKSEPDPDHPEGRTIADLRREVLVMRKAPEYKGLGAAEIADLDQIDALTAKALGDTQIKTFIGLQKNAGNTIRLDHGKIVIEKRVSPTSDGRAIDYGMSFTNLGKPLGEGFELAQGQEAPIQIPPDMFYTLRSPDCRTQAASLAKLLKLTPGQVSYLAGADVSMSANYTADTGSGDTAKDLKSLGSIFTGGTGAAY